MGGGPLPVLPNNPPTTVNVGDVAQQEVDPKNFGQLFAQGQADAGWIEHHGLAIWLGLTKSLQAAISLIASGMDDLLALIGQFFVAAQANNTPGFYNLTADLITDLTGVEVDGAALFDRYQKRGRIAAMQATGGAFVDLLASEFAGVTQTENGGVFTVGKGDGIGGLPAVQITPESGMNAARAFLGFAMSFAVREGNTDFFASLIPFGIGEGFKSYAEDLSKSLGLGRLTRLALKPLFQNLVAIPMTWAFNKQYTPTMLGAGELVRAANAKLMAFDDMREQMARHGFSVTNTDILSELHAKWPDAKQQFLVETLGQQDQNTTNTFLSILGYTEKGIEQLRIAEANDFTRRLAFELAHTLVHPVLTGAIDAATYSGVLGKLPLSDKEKSDLVALVTELLSHPRKRLTFAQMTTAFVDGIIAVDELATYLHEEGYREDDIAILLQIDLLKLGAAKAKAAAAKAKKPKTPPTPPGG
jgi:hypothetical protein